MKMAYDVTPINIFVCASSSSDIRSVIAALWYFNFKITISFKY